MTTAAVQWEAVAGVTHAWQAQCEGYVSLCGREISGFGGQRSGIRCAQCVTSSGWAEQTGESSYRTPQRPMDMDRLFNIMAQGRGVPQTIGSPRSGTPLSPRRVTRVVSLTPARLDAPPPLAPVVPPGGPDAPGAEPSGRLIPPASWDAYTALPDAEQRYWAPVMLAQHGQAPVWETSQETAAQFQQRCYAELMTIGSQG